MADSADRLAGDPNFGSGHSLDNGSHGELVLELTCFSSLCINWILQGYGAAERDDLALHRIHIPGNKENHG
jgi:hypothetical protein